MGCSGGTSSAIICNSCGSPAAMASCGTYGGHKIIYLWNNIFKISDIFVSSEWRPAWSCAAICFIPDKLLQLLIHCYGTQFL
jgi:hypothetical protein